MVLCQVRQRIKVVSWKQGKVYRGVNCSLLGRLDVYLSCHVVVIGCRGAATSGYG